MHLIRFANGSYLAIATDGSWRCVFRPEDATLFRSQARLAWAVAAIDRDDDQRLFIVPVEPY